MAAFTAKLPTHGWCAGLSNVSGAYESHHPDLTPMDAQTFYRHCVDARYPSAGGNLKKCPC